jgi:hypothetical protein
MALTRRGIFIACNVVQFQKARSPIAVTAEEKLIVPKPSVYVLETSRAPNPFTDVGVII